jgi:hypothetical protein
MRCSTIACGPNGGNINGGEFKSNHVILREWDLWYFIAPRMSIGGSVLWYDAKKIRSTVQENLEIRDDGIAGRGGDWVDVFLNWRYTF